jgi:hypothetical protein
MRCHGGIRKGRDQKGVEEKEQRSEERDRSGLSATIFLGILFQVSCSFEEELFTI